MFHNSKKKLNVLNIYAITSYDNIATKIDYKRIKYKYLKTKISKFKEIFSMGKIYDNIKQNISYDYLIIYTLLFIKYTFTFC